MIYLSGPDFAKNGDNDTAGAGDIPAWQIIRPLATAHELR